MSTVRGGQSGPARLREVPVPAWAALAERAVEPNGYYLPEWALAVDASARERSDVSVLSAWTTSRELIGLLPVIGARRAYGLPLPFLVAAEAYGTLRTPLLDRDHATEAARRLIEQAARHGAHALVLRDVPLDGKAVAAFAAALAPAGLTPTVLYSYRRAWLDATRDADTLLREALGSKRFKELRRLRQRLDETDAVSFQVARTPPEVAAALEIFLALEKSGWKGRRGTALVQHEGDAAFIRRATAGLAAKGQCEIATLLSGPVPVAAGIVLRQHDRAFWFKLGIDQDFARFSPGVQLAAELTRYVCADPLIAAVDSTAAANNSLVDPLWRERVTMGDVLIPLRPNDPWVPAIRAALAAHGFADDTARRALRFIRHLTKRRR